MKKIEHKRPKTGKNLSDKFYLNFCSDDAFQIERDGDDGSVRTSLHYIKEAPLFVFLMENPRNKEGVVLFSLS